MLPVNSYAINYVIQTIIYKNTIIKFWLHEITFRILDNLVLAKKKLKISSPIIKFWNYYRKNE